MHLGSEYLRRAAVSVLAAMWCGPISDHSFSSVSPCIQVSDSWRGPGTVCVASSWEILISPAKHNMKIGSQSVQFEIDAFRGNKSLL